MESMESQLQQVISGSLGFGSEARKIIADSREIVSNENDRLIKMKELLWRAEEAFLAG